jgi:glycosyltransferase involved in cell wall biosynthesis
VIPTFNRKGLLGKTIDSCLAQSIPCEVIVCDHGSTDGTPQFMKQYEDRVTYIRRERDFGPHFCWLEGMLHARGEFVHLQYDDDWIAPEFVEKCLSLVTDDVGIVFANAAVVNLETEEARDGMPMRRRGFTTGLYPSKKLERLYLKKRFMISPAASLLRKRDMIDALYQGNLPIQMRPVYHGVGPDSFITLLALLRYKKFGYVAEDLAFFGEHEGSITIDAHADKAKHANIKKAYQDVLTYYRILRFARQWRFLFKG